MRSRIAATLSSRGSRGPYATPRRQAVPSCRRIPGGPSASVAWPEMVDICSQRALTGAVDPSGWWLRSRPLPRLKRARRTGALAVPGGVTSALGTEYEVKLTTAVESRPSLWSRPPRGSGSRRCGKDLLQPGVGVPPRQRPSQRRPQRHALQRPRAERRSWGAGNPVVHAQRPGHVCPRRTTRGHSPTTSNESPRMCGARKVLSGSIHNGEKVDHLDAGAPAP